MKSTLGTLAAFLLCCGLSSCGGKTPEPVKDTVPVAVTNPAPTPAAGMGKVEARAFEVLDSAGKSLGWGYDLYIDGKRTIHQPIIPAIMGNRSFATQQDAQRTGDLAAAKMSRNGDLPTISEKELDSLGVLKK